jgi:hypothetical protein
MNLQLFAEEVTETNNEAEAKPDETEAKPAEEKKYDDKDLDKIIAKKYAKWKADYDKDLQAAKEEAEKLAKMNAEQKQQYEIDKLKAENAQLKKEQMRAELGKTAAGLLQESNIDATPDVLKFVVGDDAETTKANIDMFVKIIESNVKKAEVVRATGTTPRTITNNGNTMSEIDKRIAKYKL